MVNQELANQFYRLGHIERVLVDRELAPLNLRMNHARVLHFIDQHPGCLQKEVANYLDYQAASLTNLINFLEKRKMLVRKVDPENGRQRQLYLLEAGKQAVTKSDAVFAKVNHLVDDLDPRLSAVLEEKIKSLENILGQQNS